MEYIILNGENLSLDQFIKGVRNGNHILLGEDAEKRVINARRMIADALNSKRIIYGLTTGFGALSDVVISEEQTKLLQKNILMSHAAGIGNYLDVETTRGVLILKINNLAKGYSGIKPDTLKTLIELFNKGVYPLMPEKGSVGASGDLAPLAHLALVLIGQGKAFYNGDNLRRITHNSEIVSSHKDCSRIQDAYSIRCSPQVHGASLDALHYAKRVIEIEMNSATDNPLVFPDNDQIVSGGNFHGQPVALALDFLAIALSGIANISERRIERLVNPQLSGLPAFLIKEAGLNSGFMIAQYTAAALVSENKVLAHPASVDSIPTSANKEDHVSMGTIAARKCREVLKNAESVVSIEVLCAAQALDLFTNLKAGAGSKVAYGLIRQHIPHLEEDRVLSQD